MFRLALLATLATGGLIPTARIKAADPLDLVPPSAQVVVVADNPRRLAESITQLEAVKEAQKLAPIKELLDSPQARKGFQLLAFAEFGLGAKWPQLIDQLAGHGVALAIQYGGDPAPVMLVMSGTNEKQVEKVYGIAQQMIEAELARQGIKEKPTREKVNGVEVTRLGNDLHFARIGASVVVSNKAEGVKAAIEQATAEEPKRKVHPARKAALGILPKNPMAWLWLDFASVKQSKEAKDFFDATRQDFLQTTVLGATIDCLRRSDFVAAGLYKEDTGLRVALRLPAGREGLWNDLVMHVPPKGTPGSLPLLEPPGMIYSHSFHLDAGYLWKHRERLLNDQMRKDLENAEKQLSRFIPTKAKIGEMLEMWGPHHRIVVVNHDVRPYKVEPGLKLPAFGYVASSRDPKFGPSLAPLLRSAGLVGSIGFGLKMQEHEHEGCTLVAYRFDEKKELTDDPEGIRFNFEPCFAIVGDEMVFASTVEVGKKLITELKKPRTGKESNAVLRGKLSAVGAATALSDFADPLITNAVLGRGIGLAEARKEVADILAFVKTLGTVQVELDVTDKEYRVDLVWQIK